MREKIVDKRERIGDWEGDTIVGGEKTTGILTHVERKSGYLIADLLKKKKLLKDFRSYLKTKDRPLPMITEWNFQSMN